MKKIIFFLSIFCIVTYSEELSILNESKNSKVYLNGVYIGNETIKNHFVEPGEYIVTIKKDDNILFKETVTVKSGESKILDAITFVKLPTQSQVINIGAKQEEEKRLKKSTRGNMAGGFSYVQPYSGLSIKWYPLSKFGFQGIGWASSKSGKSEHHYRLRALYELQETLINVDSLAVLYVGLGVGRDYYNNSNEAPSFGWVGETQSTQQKLTDNLMEGFFGIEINAGTNIYFHIEAIIIKHDKTTTYFSNPTESKNNDIEAKIAFGSHIYFN